MDRDNPLPLYVQVEKMLESKIVTGEWEPGFQVPPEQELAARLDVSTITIKRAIIDLVSKGLLYRRRGKGTFVTQTVAEKNIHRSVFFETEGHAKTLHKLLECQSEVAGPFISRMLEIEATDDILKIKRVGFENEEPISLEYTYVPLQFFSKNFIDGMEGDLIYNILKDKYKMKLKKAKSYFSAIAADKQQSKLLQVPERTPLFVWERVTYNETEQIVEYSQFIMRQDKEKYFIEVELV